MLVCVSFDADCTEMVSQAVSVTSRGAIVQFRATAPSDQHRDTSREVRCAI